MIQRHNGCGTGTWRLFRLAPVVAIGAMLGTAGGTTAESRSIGSAAKPKVIVTTDGGIDDHSSMIRLSKGRARLTTNRRDPESNP